LAASRCWEIPPLKCLVSRLSGPRRGFAERKLDHQDGALKHRGLLRDCRCILAVIAGQLRSIAWGHAASVGGLYRTSGGGNDGGHDGQTHASVLDRPRAGRGVGSRSGIGRRSEPGAESRFWLSRSSRARSATGRLSARYANPCAAATAGTGAFRDGTGFWSSVKDSATAIFSSNRRPATPARRQFSRVVMEGRGQDSRLLQQVA